MLITPASPLPQLPSLAPPTDAPAPDAAAPSHSFARLLAQRREAAATPAPQAHQGNAAERSQTGPAQTAHHTDDAAQPAAQRRGPARETGKGRDGAARQAALRGDAEAKAEAHAAADAAGSARGSKDAAGQVDPALADWLASLPWPDPQQPAATALPSLPATPITPPATAAAETGPTATGDATLSLQAAAGHGQCASGPDNISRSVVLPEPNDPARPLPPRGEGQHHDSGADANDEPNQAAATAPQSPQALQTGADKLAATFSVAAPAAAAAAPHLPVVAMADATLAAAAAQAVAAPLGHDAARPQPVVLNTPLAAPEFPQALGVRIGVLAQGGIEHAELQLNPADMGPVSVRIVVDGAQARVDFGADVAATRQAIEASLPALAGALREAGFTLTGGGVSQHAQPQRDGGGQGQAGSGGTGARGEPGQPGDSAMAAQRQPLRAGGIDVYA